MHNVVSKRVFDTVFYNRRFQVWEYKVSHQQLLIRSPKSQDHDTNLDLIFVGVDYLALPKSMDGISIVPPNEAELRFASEFRKESQRIVLESAGQRHLVIAAKFQVSENTLDLFESSLESFNTPP